MRDAGHLIEAGVAFFQATGKRRLLEVVCRLTDHIDSVFGPDESKLHGYPGHPEIELALMRLYEVTEEPRYLALTNYFVEQRGAQPHYYDQDNHVTYFHLDQIRCRYDRSDGKPLPASAACP
ncbi:hypothetical protein AWG59_03575 [Escherichia coli]|nr:hypothetical protein AWG59_03575 [Escherichia coli]